MSLKNDYIAAFAALKDDTIVYYDERIVKNFKMFFYRENLNYFNYELNEISSFINLYSNKISKTYYPTEYIIVENDLRLNEIVDKQIEDFKYLNGIIQEAFRKKDFFLVKARNVKYPAVKNRVFGNTGGPYENIVPSDIYPFIEL